MGKTADWGPRNMAILATFPAQPQRDGSGFTGIAGLIDRAPDGLCWLKPHSTFW